MSTTEPSLPVFDLRKLARGELGGLHEACARGLFYVERHGIDEVEIEALAALAREFFAWDLERKLEWRMERGGRAWRGYFPLGGELTSGRPDQKEGLYFGQQLKREDPRVVAGTPLHGRNLYPPLAGFAERIERYMNELERVGQSLLCAIAQSIGLEADGFARQITREPLLLFRIFHYPVQAAERSDPAVPTLGVGPHSDYGLLTLLWQDAAGGLQVRLPHGAAEWTDVPPRSGTLVCNLGDMLERMSGGRCHSITHRVVAPRRAYRIAMPFFLDPGFDVALAPLLSLLERDCGEGASRWDGESVHAFEGTYGDYLLRKVGRVFPQLRDNVLE